MFFVKAAFWLALVIAFIPVSSEDLPVGDRAVSTVETVSLAKSVIDDVMTFCERNEQTCETGSVLASQMGAKAREGARIAYTWLDERYKPEGSAVVETEGKLDTVKTGSLD